jgi:hypothetical protein
LAQAASSILAPQLHVPAYRDDKRHHLHSQPAQNERRSHRYAGKQNNRRNREKETSWHHEQSGILHGVLSGGSMTENRAAIPRSRQKIENELKKKGSSAFMNFKCPDCFA